MIFILFEGWLRGGDLNPGPLGYEGNFIVARPCCSMTYDNRLTWFYLLFWGILWQKCGRKTARDLKCQDPPAVRRHGSES